MVSYISIVMVVHLVVDQHIPAVHMSVRSNKWVLSTETVSSGARTGGRTRLRGFCPEEEYLMARSPAGPHRAVRHLFSAKA